MDFRVISIGVLSLHELWDHQVPARTPHATTVLVRSNGKVILVDPGLPEQVIQARLAERAGLDTADITDVFLTNFRPAHRSGLHTFAQANWLISELERESIGRHLISRLAEEEDPEARRLIEQDIQTLKRFKAAPDKIADQVDLFPLPGFTPGSCGLLLSHATSTILIAGDAVATTEHLEQGRVLRNCYDTDQARESLREAIEIADIIIPGHDNVLFNPTRRPF